MEVGSLKKKILRQMISAAVCWYFWLERNGRTFNNYFELVHRVFQKAKDHLGLSKSQASSEPSLSFD